MLHLWIVFQKVNYRNFFSSQYDNRLPLESVQLRTTKTFINMWLIKYSLWPYTTFLKTKSFGDFQYLYCIQSRLQQFLEKLNDCKCVVFPHSHNKTTKKAYIYSLIRTHYLHTYSYQYWNECTNETKEDYCFNYCYGQTSGALTTLALENNCTHWNS